jgi:exopolysaccharide biosynthesis polyprenyl glycosylphosphotransferase
MTRDESLEAAILIQDVLLLVAALLLAQFVHAAFAHAIPALKPPVAPGEYAHLLVVFLPIWILAAERLGIHRVRLFTGPRIELARLTLITQGFGLVAVALILVAAQTSLNRSLIAIFFLVSTAVLLAAHPIQARWIARRRGESLVLLIGDVSEDLIGEIGRARGRRVEHHRSSDLAQLGSRLHAGSVDEVMLAGPSSAADARSLLELSSALGIPALVPLAHGVDDLGFPPPRVEAVGRAHYLVYQRQRPGAPSLIVKALQDRLWAGLLLVVLSPLLLLIAVAVRLFVGSPLFFVQRRGGLYGRPFSMVKFRTMRKGADAERAALLGRNEMDGPVFKLTDDPRVTRFGRLLRRTSLDELPQLLNVLAGQMSLVGPRPLPVEETEALRDGHRRRLSMRPGLTCLWQVSGRNELSFKEWMALDLRYVDTWSLGLDLAILLRTLPAIISGRGAR